MNQHDPSPAAGLPPENSYAAFLAVRRGLPLTVSALAFLGAALHAPFRGWWLVLAVAALALARPTFARGDTYLRNRTSIVRWDGRWALLFRPLARWLGREDAWILSFCAWNNLRVREVFEIRKAERSLILLPHCVQLAKCKAPILDDLSSCYDCGLCPVGDYMNAVLEGGWDSRITNRSHKAYREAREFRPNLILAVSCTDRLLKGLTRLPEIPSYVIPLSLPHGMCVDTQFSMSHLTAAMASLAQRKVQPRIQPMAQRA